MSWIEPVRLAGEHVTLKPVGDEALDHLFEAAQEDDIWAWLPWSPPRSRGDMAQIVASARSFAIPFAQIERSSGRAVGMTNYADIQPEHRTLEVGGTWLAGAWWRTELNTEAKLLLLGHAFEVCGAHRVTLKTADRFNRRRAGRGVGRARAATRPR